MESPGTKEFLRNRGLKTTGNKDELTALAFGAEQLLKLTVEKKIIQKKKKQYQSHLNVNGEPSYQIRSRNSKMIESDLVDNLWCKTSLL